MTYHRLTFYPPPHYYNPQLCTILHFQYYLFIQMDKQKYIHQGPCEIYALLHYTLANNQMFVFFYIVLIIYE